MWLDKQWLNTLWIYPIKFHHDTKKKSERKQTWKLQELVSGYVWIFNNPFLKRRKNKSFSVPENPY